MKYDFQIEDILAHIRNKDIHIKLSGQNFLIDTQYNHYSKGNLLSITSGNSNVILGNWSTNLLTTGAENVVIGANTANSLTTENGNVIVGANAGADTAGNYNTLIGYGAGGNTSDISYVSALGHYAGYRLSSSEGGVYVGAYAGQNIEDDNSLANTIIGYNACQEVSGTSVGLIAIGVNAGPSSSGTYTNEGWIDNRKTDRALINLKLGEPGISTDPRQVWVNGDLIITEDIAQYLLVSSKYTKLLLHFDNDFSDSSPSGHSVTNNGAEIITSDKKFGDGCADFERTDHDYLQIPTSTDFDFGTNDFTIEFWVKHETMPAGTYPPSYTHYTYISRCVDINNYFSFLIGNYNYMSTNHYRLKFILRKAGSYDIVAVSDDISDLTDGWHHLMLCRCKTKIYMFLDGNKLNLTGDDTGSVIEFPSWDAELQVGDWNSDNDTMYDGLMDELRITNGIAWCIDDFQVANVAFGNFIIGGGATSNHASLYNLDYDSSGHTGFEPTVAKGSVSAGSTKVTLSGSTTNAVIGSGFTIDIDETKINHSNLLNTHNLTTDIDHNSIANTHNLTTDISHNSIANTHNLTTDIDHGSISGLADDDHTQYLLANGSRSLSADWDIGSGRVIKTDKIQARSSSGLYLIENTSNKGIFIKDSNGYVGIGTSSPSYQLHVESSTEDLSICSWATGSTKAAQLAVLNNASFYFQQKIHGSSYSGTYAGLNLASMGLFRAVGVSSMVISNHTNSPLVFATGGTPVERMRITHTGSIGIGTTSPSAMLAVNGGLHVGGDSDPGDNNLLVDGKVEIDGDLDHDGTKIGFFGVTPATRASAYTITNATTDRSYDANATTIDELADVLATLIDDLKSYGLLQ